MRIKRLIKRGADRLKIGTEHLVALSKPNARRLAKLRLLGVSDDFSSESGTKVKRRKYRSYAAYVDHQKSKLDMLLSGDTYGLGFTDIKAYDAKFRRTLNERLSNSGLNLKGKSALCLAARIGTEVKAFIDQGAFAVGVDLNPGPDNSYVVSGDFHHLVFADESVDVIYSNSLDHAFDLSRLVGEMSRILKKGGHLLVELQAGVEEGARQNTGTWEATEWESIDDIISIFEGIGYSLESKCPFEDPWVGFFCVFRKHLAQQVPSERAQSAC